MANIFLQLGEFRFKREALEKITQSGQNEEVQNIIDQFYQSGKTGLNDYSDILIKLIPKVNTREGKDKLLISLVYFIVNEGMAEKDAFRHLESINTLNQPTFLKVKFFSFVFKSTNNQALKKWLIKNTVTCIENQPKISYYAGFIEHFDVLVEALDLTNEETVQLYSRLINYLEKHPVYKKLCSQYVIRSLQKVTDSISKSRQTSLLITKAIKYGSISDSALTLLNHTPLHQNENYPLLEVLLKGDFEKLEMSMIEKYEKDGVVGKDVLRKMKIQAIPRLLGNIKIANYDQVAQVLQITKDQVEFYIIDAIKEGILKAKLDQFQETVIISGVNFRALRVEERVKLQKDITDICENLTNKMENLTN